MSNPFPGSDAGLPPNLIPNVPNAMPEAPGAGNAVAGLSPFSEPQDLDAIFAQLMLDRPLKLFIPNKEKYPDWEFHIINDVPGEISAAHNKGFRRITDPELSGLFDDLVSGTDKTGKPYRPVLMARPKAVGKHIANQHRKQLHSLYAGMNPANKEFSGKYTENAGVIGGTKGQFSGPTFNIKLAR